MPKLLGLIFSDAEAGPCAELAASLGADLTIASFGQAPPNAAGANECLVLKCSASHPADAVADALKSCAAGFECIAAASSMAAKDILFRLAGLLDAAAVTDVTTVDGPNKFTRAILAGSVYAKVETAAAQTVLTFRASSFPASAVSGPAPAQREVEVPASKVTIVSEDASTSARPDLGQATVVVSGGKPLGSPEKFEEVIGGLADALGGAVGATRAAVDSGIAPNDLQVGQTGKVVAPDLYIAAGISGATQHVAGIKDSKLIVAINKDAEAPIFDIADIGLVADLFQAVPELTAKVKKQL